MAFFGLMLVEDLVSRAWLQPPDKQLLQQLPEQVDSTERKRTQEPLDGMRRRQSFVSDQGPVTLVHLELIQPGQMTTGTVHEKISTCTNSSIIGRPLLFLCMEPNRRSMIGKRAVWRR